mgnify:CR=1 FL=1
MTRIGRFVPANPSLKEGGIVKLDVCDIAKPEACHPPPPAPSGPWTEAGFDGNKLLEFQQIGMTEEDYDYALCFYLIRFPWAREQPNEEQVKEIVRRVWTAYSCQCSHDCCGCGMGYTGDVVGKAPCRDQWIVCQSLGRNI